MIQQPPHPPPYPPHSTRFTQSPLQLLPHQRLWEWYPRASKNVQMSLAGLVLLLALCACASSADTSTVTKTTATRPVALVYRGPGGCEGCSEAVAALLQSSKWNFDVKYVGPSENLSISDGLKLPNVKLYAQPGGDGSLSQAYRQLKSDARDIQNFVKNGGRYLGLCMGGYLAGKAPGFNLLPGDTNAFITSPGATVKTAKDTIVQVNWRGESRYMYFQDGPYFILNPGATGVTVLATYTNSEIAAMVVPYGQGKVGVSGPHPEADANWYQAYHLVNPDGLTADLGHDLIDTLMQ